MMITKEQDIIIKYVSVKPFVELNECAYVKLHPINKEKRYVVSTECYRENTKLILKSLMVYILLQIKSTITMPFNIVVTSYSNTVQII